MPTSLESVLAGHPFCKDLEHGYLQLLVGCAFNVVFRPGEQVFRMDEQTDRFYLIRSGKIAIELYVAVRGSVTVETLSEGDVLGWSWLIPPYRSTFGARAVELTHAVGIDGKCLRGKCATDHDLGYELFTRVAPILVHRLESTRLQLLDLYRAEG